MKSAKRRIAIKALAGLAMATACGLALAAQVAGSVIQLSGPLVARKADGTVKALARQSEVEQGDTLVSEKNTYAQIRFIDNSEITLRPGTVFKIEAFAYDGAKPEADSASFSLVKGGLRAITGALGKRSKEKFLLKTPTATIGIRGTTFVAQFIETDQVLGDAGRGIAPGLHVSVLDGAIVLSNAGGAQQFAAGQFGYVRTTATPPVIVPSNPALRFAAPPTFTSVNAAGSNAGGGASAAVDCEVR